MSRSYLLVDAKIAGDVQRLVELDAGAVAAYCALWQPELLVDLDAVPWLRDAGNLPQDAAALAIGKTAYDKLSAVSRTDLVEFKSRLIVADDDADSAALTTEAAARSEPFEDSLELRREFAALGFAYLGLKVIYAHMPADDPLDVESFLQSVRNAGQAFLDGEREATDSDLTNCFDALHNARMSVYPATINWLEFALLPPDLTADAVRKRAAEAMPFNLLATGKELEELESRDADALAQLIEAMQNNYLEILGSTYDDKPLSLQPASSVLWQFNEASRIQERLLNRAADCFGSRVGQLGPDSPSMLSKLGFRYALHAAFDGSRQPHFREPKIQWTASDGTPMECLSRVARPASDSTRPLLVFEDLANTIAKDRSATVVVARWFNQPCRWLDTILRIHRRATVFGKFATFSDFFLSSSFPDGSTKTTLEEYATTGSIDGDAWAARLQAVAAFDRTATIEALLAIATGEPNAEAAERRSQFERGQIAGDALNEFSKPLESRLADLILEEAADNGWLVFNPTAAARRGCVILKNVEASSHIEVGGPVKAVQQRDGDVLVVVDVPGYGYTWLAAVSAEQANSMVAAPSADKSAAGGLFRKAKPDKAPLASGRRLANEFIEAEIDHRTGGLRGIWVTRSGYSRVGQQLVFSDGGRSVCEKLEVRSSGPAFGEMIATGSILPREGTKPLAKFVQRFSIWASRPVLEIETEITALTELAAGSEHYFASRWAWPDDKAKLTVADGIAMHPHRRGDFETPWVFELRERNLTTSIFPHGLPFHRRIGTRMADTPILHANQTQSKSAFSIGLDLANPWSTIDDTFSPPIAFEARCRKPKAGKTGWLIHQTPSDIRCLQLQSIAGETPVIRFGLIETTGKSVRATIRFCRNPSHCRLVNAKGEMLFELYIDGDSINVDFSAHEMLFVEATF